MEAGTPSLLEAQKAELADHPSLEVKRRWTKRRLRKPMKLTHADRATDHSDTLRVDLEELESVLCFSCSVYLFVIWDHLIFFFSKPVERTQINKITSISTIRLKSLAYRQSLPFFHLKKIKKNQIQISGLVLSEGELLFVVGL